MLAWIALATGAQVSLAVEVDDLPRVVQKLVPPPLVPEHDQLASGGPKVVQVRMVIEEKKIEIDDEGTEVWAMTFGGTVPGPMIVLHQDDYLELTLVNPSTNALVHNIDFHAATGAMGGAELTKVGPGEETTIRFKATRPGVFVYICCAPGGVSYCGAPGGIMTPWHVVSGMNGALLVLPRDGLKDQNRNPVRYDRAYYLGEQDFYVSRDEFGQFRSYDSVGAALADIIETMRGQVPSHIVFNGSTEALTRRNAIRARVGETLLIMHSQANRDSRPRLIGGHADYVWPYGSFSNPPLTNAETWFIPGGSAGAMVYTFQQPGLYAYVNHNLIEASLKGAAAHIKVEGEWDDDLMLQVKPPGPIPE
jgi:nitrite reductase (NO-forming)